MLFKSKFGKSFHHCCGAQIMTRIVLAACLAFAFSLPVSAAVKPFPSTFQVRDIQANGATIHVRVGGKGSAVVLLHGFGDTGDMWEPLAEDLARDHTVVVPDLRGLGLSSHPAAGYEKNNQAADVQGVLAQLGIKHAVIVGHDIGTMVAYA
jgi:alpha-beta hydrolase superfamily lysophospholipase